MCWHRNTGLKALSNCQNWLRSPSPVFNIKGIRLLQSKIQMLHHAISYNLCVLSASLQTGQGSIRDYILNLPEAFLCGKVKATAYSSALKGSRNFVDYYVIYQCSSKCTFVVCVRTYE